MSLFSKFPQRFSMQLDFVLLKWEQIWETRCQTQTQRCWPHTHTSPTTPEPPSPGPLPQWARLSARPPDHKGAGRGRAPPCGRPVKIGKWSTHSCSERRRTSPSGCVWRSLRGTSMSKTAWFWVPRESWRRGAWVGWEGRWRKSTGLAFAGWPRETWDHRQRAAVTWRPQPTLRIRQREHPRRGSRRRKPWSPEPMHRSRRGPGLAAPWHWSSRLIGWYWVEGW